MIDPGTNVQGEDMEAYCRRRWGGAGWTHSLKIEGKKDGAKFENWKWWPHTLKAHQLVQYCSEEEGNNIPSDKVNRLLFEAEYENGQNLSDVNVLVEIGKALGIQDEKDLALYLALDKGEEQVKRDIALGRQRYQISGVPHFIISSGDQDRQSFSGAQKPKAFLSIFEALAEEE
mmetsp:Transcript_6215/g.9554  ORF Transcript_6215/g.9554 Transcript_6215/m.9554 type:complete len:174 (-) Transcript_6215:280-801(-)|eukprot:CAMPEP_0178909984 /NCGR_PEP_ID=MMETSP0786-20121207/8843_1 /TAXON_ID=186022 /ORGANISM="Thalassionema frauenfeldii, Strain CCMP 1798" /LENGTH=173 /DNA_ID=CAMNT_0020582181 /DNA_START=176 /DNA_END=697 /DNA_ORIENTATION=-